MQKQAEGLRAFSWIFFSKIAFWQHIFDYPPGSDLSGVSLSNTKYATKLHQGKILEMGISI
jgi:hypothetical protein